MAKEQRCFTTSTDEEKTASVADRAAVWCKRVLAVASVKGSSLRRSPEEWQAHQQSEMRKMSTKHSVKNLIPMLSAQFPLSNPPADFPPEVLEGWQAAVEPQKEGSEEQKSVSNQKAAFEAKLASLKKDLLVAGIVSIQIQTAKDQEEQHCQQWKDQVGIALRVRQERGEGAEGIDWNEAGGDQDGPDNEVAQLPKALDNRQWQAHRAAAFATSVIMQSFAASGSPHLQLEAEGAKFQDTGREHVSIIKKKLCVRVEEVEGKPGRDYSQDLSAICLCLAGRLVVVPQGQPLSSHKGKFNVASAFFSRLGCDLYLVPITKQESPTIAVKSPLFVPGWLVKPKKEGYTMEFKQVLAKVSLQHCVTPTDEENRGFIDLALPTLVCRSSGWDQTKVKATDGKSMVGIDLTREFTPAEVSDGDEKSKKKEEKLEEKRKRQARLEEDLGDVDVGGQTQDHHCDLPASFIRHILR